jgi:excisionase family DNA binding protein
MQMLSVPQVAEELGVSIKTVRRELAGKRPTLSSTKIRSVVRVSRETLLGYIQSRTTQGQY